MSPDHVGSLAQEAAKLIASVQAWTREVGADSAPWGPDDRRSDDAESAEAYYPVSDESRPAAATDAAEPDGWHDAVQHTPLECRVCPVCNFGRFARTLTPDIRGHLASAGLSLALAVKGLLEGIDEQGARAKAAEDDDPTKPAGSAPSAHIDLTED